MLRRTLQGLRPQEQHAHAALFSAVEVARNRKSMSPGDRALLRRSEAPNMNAANPASRVIIGNALWREFRGHFGLTDGDLLPKVPLFFVTAVDISCMTTIGAKVVPIDKFISHLRSGLRGLSYIGFIEPALFANIAPGAVFEDRTGVNWHLHVIVWGECYSSMKERAQNMNRRDDNYRPIVPRGKVVGFHWLPMGEDNIERRLRYMCKSPRKAYRVGRAEKSDSKGQKQIKLVQSRSQLRPGQRIELFHMLKHFYVDQLLVAGGEGVAIRRRALKI